MSILLSLHTPSVVNARLCIGRETWASHNIGGEEVMDEQPTCACLFVIVIGFFAQCHV